MPMLNVIDSRRLAVSVRVRLADIYTAANSFEEARQMLDELADLAPDDQILARRRLEYYLFDERDFSRAASLAYAARDRGGDQDMVALRAIAMFAYAAEIHAETGLSETVRHWSESARNVSADPNVVALIASQDTPISQALESLQALGLGVSM